jgi:hypothetical protein
LLRRGISRKLWAGNRYTNKLSKILEEFLAEVEEYPGKLCLGTGTHTDSKGFCENSRLGKGIYGKTQGFIREKYSWLGRVWSMTSQLGAGKGTGIFFKVKVLRIQYRTVSLQ